MKKIIIAICLVLALQVGLVIWVLISIGNVEDRYKAHLGETIVVSEDTSTVVDYSILMETFTLSNGKTVSGEFVDRINKKK